MGTFETFYNSPLQHPWVLWVAAAFACGVVVGRREIDPGLRRYLFGLVALSVADAWLSSHHVYGIGKLEGVAASVVPLFFVLSGDLRFLFLAQSARADGSLEVSGRNLGMAFGLMLIVPLTTQGIMALLPEAQATPRVMFLIYEIEFVVLTLVLRARNANVLQHPWLGRVSGFVIVYYSLWATADAIVLFAGSDLGFALRVIPNGLYYGGLIAAMAIHAPRVEGAGPEA